MITYVLSLCTREKNLTQIKSNFIMENKRTKPYLSSDIFNKYNNENDLLEIFKNLNFDKDIWKNKVLDLKRNIEKKYEISTSFH